MPIRSNRLWHKFAATCTLFISSLWLPAARADIFVSSSGGPIPAPPVSSFSQTTGAYKFSTVGRGQAGLALGPDGYLYAVDTSGVGRYNPATGALVSMYVSFTFTGPAGIAFGPDGNLYVADIALAKVVIFNSSGVQIGAIVSGVGESFAPFGVTFGPDGNLYVGDEASFAVLKFNGTTWAFMSKFAYISTFYVPLGVHFGPDGNLYVAFIFPGSFVEIVGFDGTSGARLIFQTAPTGAVDFAFASNGNIYVAGDGSIEIYSGTTGGWMGPFTSDSHLSGTENGFILIEPPPSPYAYLNFNYISLVAAPQPQTIRLTAVNGPIRVPPGVPVQAILGFVDLHGNSIGPSMPVILNPGQTASLDLVASTITSGRISVRPVVTSLPGAPAQGSLEASVEVFEAANGFGTVFAHGVHTVPVVPIFVPQGVAYGQTIQINVAAPPDSPCVAALGFEDNNGNPVGPSSNVNLSPSHAAVLDFNVNSLTGHAGQRIEVQPMVTPQNAAGGPASVCQASVEVFDQRTKHTWTYQDSGGTL